MNFEQPKELLSRLCDDESDLEMIMVRDDLYSRMDALCKKLTELELALRAIHHTGGDSIYMAREKVWWIERAIGVYRGVHRVDNWRADWRAEKVYPKTYNHSVAAKWNDLILGKEKSSGIILVMLSPEAVDWLNKIDLWIKRSSKNKHILC